MIQSESDFIKVWNSTIGVKAKCVLDFYKVTEGGSFY